MIISLVLDKQGEQDDWSQWRRNSDFQLNFTEDKLVFEANWKTYQIPVQCTESYI